MARREENDICLSLDPLTYLPSVIDSGPKVIIVQSRAFMMTPSFQVEYFALRQGSTAGWGVGGGGGVGMGRCLIFPLEKIIDRAPFPWATFTLNVLYFSV